MNLSGEIVSTQNDLYPSGNQPPLSGSVIRFATNRQVTQRSRIAVLDLGRTQTGVLAGDRIWAEMSQGAVFTMFDREQSRAAARGANYANSLNMTLMEARSLGASIGCDYFITGRAETVRRSGSDDRTYYEAMAAVFVISARTGKLLMWDFASLEADSAEAAESRLLRTELRSLAARASVSVHRGREDEEIARRRASEEAHAVTSNAAASNAASDEFEELPEDGTTPAQNFRPPQPFRRARPPYTEAARRAEAEATVDVTVEIDADGEVGRIEVVRWAGFGLDQSVVETVRQMHFRPAMRDGAPVPVRVLLRYNFRRPQETESAPNAS